MFFYKWWGRGGEKGVTLLLNLTLDLLGISNIIKEDLCYYQKMAWDLKA